MGTSRVGNHPLKMGTPVQPKNQTSQEQQNAKNQTRIAQETNKPGTTNGQEPHKNSPRNDLPMYFL